MTKSDLIEAVAEQTNVTRSSAEAVVKCVFDAMTDALVSGEGIEVRGFGSFTVRQYKPYDGRNPRNGEAVHVASKRMPCFKVGKELKERWMRVRGSALPFYRAPKSTNGFLNRW